MLCMNQSYPSKNDDLLDLLFGSGLRAHLLTWLHTHTDETFHVLQFEDIRRRR